MPDNIGSAPSLFDGSDPPQRNMCLFPKGQTHMSIVNSLQLLSAVCLIKAGCHVEAIVHNGISVNWPWFICNLFHQHGLVLEDSVNKIHWVEWNQSSLTVDSRINTVFSKECKYYHVIRFWKMLPQIKKQWIVKKYLLLMSVTDSE